MVCCFWNFSCSGAATSVSALAQDIEEVVVTGSRIRSMVSDALRPVTAIDAVDLQLSGVDSVTDALRDSSYNSLGSYTQ